MGREQAVGLVQSEVMTNEKEIVEVPVPAELAADLAAMDEVEAAQDAAEAPAAQDAAETPAAEGAAETPAAEDVAEAPAAEDVAEAPAAEEAADAPAAEETAEDAADAPAAEEAAEDAAETPTAEEATEAVAVVALAGDKAVKDPAATDKAEAEPAATSQDPKQRWYVVHAYSGFESYVKKVLESRIVTSEHKAKLGAIMVPTEEVVEMRDGTRRKSERKFFPGYVLVQMEMDNDTWHLVKQVPKVLGFIGGTSDKPAPISEAEADAILNRVEEGVDKPRPKVLFEVGEVVRVNDGPFNDFNGVVEEVNYEKSKMLVSVQIFGRSTPVELAFGQVEKG